MAGTPADAGLSDAEMLRRVSRTFALSIELLPGSLRDAMTVAYLMFRVSDCLEDHKAMSAGRKSDLLRLWARVVRGEVPADRLTDSIADLDMADAEVYVARHAGQVVAGLASLPDAARGPIASHVARTSEGMARWQDHGPFVEDEAALDDYMHEVAGRVGYLATDLYAWHSPSIRRVRERLMPLGRESGLALQTVNVIRGIRSDHERGWVFVPRSFCDAAGVPPEALLDPAYRDRSLRVVQMLAEKAAMHLGHAVEYVTLLPRRNHRIRIASMLPMFLATATLALSRDNPAVLTSQAKLDRATVRTIARRSTTLGWSNRWLRRYYEDLSRGRERVPA